MTDVEGCFADHLENLGTFLMFSSTKSFFTSSDNERERKKLAPIQTCYQVGLPTGSLSSKCASFFPERLNLARPIEGATNAGTTNPAHLIRARPVGKRKPGQLPIVVHREE